MSYQGRLLAEVRGKHPEWTQLAELALNEARVWGKNEGAASIRVQLTGAEGMSTEGLALWVKVASEYLCFVAVGYTGAGWYCVITCPDTGVTSVGKQLAPESALRACVAKWAEKMRAAHPHLREEGVVIP